MGGVPILFKNNFQLDYLIKLNEDDMSGHLGKEFYEPKGYAKHIINIIKPKKKEKILDLECGHGHVSEWIIDKGSDVVSVDILYESLKYGKNKKNPLFS